MESSSERVTNLVGYFILCADAFLRFERRVSNFIAEVIADLLATELVYRESPDSTDLESYERVFGQSSVYALLGKVQNFGRL
jgi:hypothetical protein